MSAIRYDYNGMINASNNIDGYAVKFKSDAAQLESAIMQAIATWEGDSRDKFVTFLQGAVKEHIHENIPQIVTVLGALVKNSADNMEKTDQQLASSIPQSLS